MHVPPWLGITLASLVILFGCYRMWIAFGGPSDEERAEARRGMLRMPRRQHAFIGVLYLLVGGALMATSFGWNPFSRSKPAATAPAGDPSPPGGAGGSGGSAIPIAP